ncbi:hypothetical protein P831_02296 [Klebsiella aerogenes UCI 28]|nr:hypothetical protein P848_00612 [Klebsiella aerogenes UCI 45]EUL78973.1 hypothetical protein P831_02296 [Klebsiella aerogenes UCI 28]EUL90667.1 hypothetical protein P830_00272 [Klebsiella aerogenes UCI 27]MCP1409108.1 hypothetical protein [Klebsiella aerogenes]VAE34839.1 Uncharacterised protein [Klebsiella aerogenes]
MGGWICKYPFKMMIFERVSKYDNYTNNVSFILRLPDVADTYNIKGIFVPFEFYI